MRITPYISFLLQKINQINYPRAMKMDSGICFETVRSMDAVPEPTGMYSRRVSE